MQREGVQMVVVDGPAGEALGVVTIEDILEEIVGDIRGELEEEEPAVRLLENGEAIVRGNVRVADVNRVLGTKFRVVTGYPGSRQITLAIDRNEVHGACGIGWTGLPTLYPHWFERKLVNIVVQASVKEHPDLKRMGVPSALDFARSAEDRQAMELVFSQGLFGRPYVLPPDVPPERVAALRKAFAAALEDKALTEEADKMKLDLDLVTGEELQATVAKLFALPAATVNKAKQSLIYKQ